MTAAMKIEPFRIAAPEAALDDLRRRLDNIRWPVEPIDAGWRYGANLGYMRKFADYWRDGYDWRLWEAELNRWPQFVADLGPSDHGDLKIHFLHEKGSGANPLPLLITHGWPGSVFEFHKIVEPLAHPERFGGNADDAFSPVCPSLPGYGFSGGLVKPMPPRAIAALWRRLMVEGLGYKRFVAQAGDWGSIVTSWLALDYPADVAAIHLNMIAFRPNLGPAAPPLSADEKAWIERTRRRLADEGGYMAIQSTKPQSLAFGLSDSPIGLAAWIVEKFHGWPGAKPDQPPPFSMDELITNLMLYWLTNSIASANWMYWAARHLPGGIVLGPGEKVAVPTGFCLPPFDLFPVPPDSWLSRAYNLAHRVDLARGGHFVALEQPAELAADIRRFFRQFR